MPEGNREIYIYSLAEVRKRGSLARYGKNAHLPSKSLQLVCGSSLNLSHRSLVTPDNGYLYSRRASPPLADIELQCLVKD